MEVMKQESEEVEPTFGWFDRTFDDWMKGRPLRRVFGGWVPDNMIHVDEYQENGTLVVKAELPGIDPEKDVELTVVNGMLRIEAERREEESAEEKGYLRREFRYGSFTRTLALPVGVSEADIKATYKDGILEVRIPSPEPKPITKVAITKS